MNDIEDAQFLHFPEPRDAECPLHPPGAYARAREKGPVTRVAFPSDQRVWMVTGYEECQQLLLDGRLSADWSRPTFPFPAKNPRQVLDHLYRYTRALTTIDAPEHTERRRALMAEFTVRQAESMRPRIEEIVDRQIDELLDAGRPADLAHHVSHAVSSLVICEVLGTPAEDTDFVKQRTSTILSHTTTAAERGAATNELLRYFERLVAAKQRKPGDDAFSRVVERNRDAGVFDQDLLVALMVLLLMGGHETTGEMISLGAVGLLTFPDQLAKVRADPALIPDAVEELLRFFSVAGGTLRVAKEEIAIGGRRILPGDGLMLHLATAARDPAAFAHPDELDVTRGTRKHLAFGHGAHQCIGQNIARVELEVALGRLFERLPTLRLCEPLTEMSFKTDSLMFGLYHLTVTW